MSTALVKPQAFLRNAPLFRELAAEEIERVAAGTRLVYLKRGDLLFQKGDPCRGFCIVVYGQIQLVLISPTGEEKVMDLMGQAQSFGEAIMFLGVPHPASAQAVVDSLVLHVSRDVVIEEIRRDPSFALRMLAGLSRRYHRLVTDVESYSLCSATQRVVSYLLRLDNERKDTASARPLSLPASKSAVASRLNITPEHFSRILHELSQAGIIAVQGRTISILSPEGLRAFEGK